MLDVQGVVLVRGGRRVLDGVHLQVAAGEVVTVVGASGSGKTSLLHCIAGLISPEAGEVSVDGSIVSALSGARRASWRLRQCGLVFQFGELLPELTLRENVELPLRLIGTDVEGARRRSGELLERVGIAEQADSLPARVSGGQLQRAAIARGVAVQPRILLADEPTGALDAETGAAAAALLFDVARDTGSAAVIATHNPVLAAMADRCLRMVAGRLVPYVA